MPKFELFPEYDVRLRINVKSLSIFSSCKNFFCECDILMLFCILNNKKYFIKKKHIHFCGQSALFKI